MEDDKGLSVDNTENEVRRVPMRVLALGLSRTGTESLQKALLRLGFAECYHAWRLLANPGPCKTWSAWLDAKYLGQGKIPGRKEFDVVLGDCQASFVRANNRSRVFQT
ncbi:MAG: hypothetical protein Q9163_002385 [Psora crenata]